MTGAKTQLRFGVNSDNRGGAVTVQAGGGESDPRTNSYNNDPGENPYGKIQRRLSETDGTGSKQVSATLVTSSEFVGYSKGECSGLSFVSQGSVALPGDSSAVALGIVQDRIEMGIRIQQTGKVRLKASVVADLDIVEISFSGPSFDKPIKIYDSYDQTLDITKPGEYSLRGGYQLAVRLPDPSLGGRPLSVEMQATLTPAS